MILETVGVPSNIINVAREIYDKLFYDMSNFKDIGELVDNPMSFRGDFQISDYKFNEVIVEITFDEYNKIDIASMNFHMSNPYLKNNEKLHYRSNFKKIELSIDFVGPSDTTLIELLDYMKKNRTEIVVSLTHEFKHAYDIYKQPHESTKKRSEYMTIQTNRFSNIKPLNDLLFNIYFIHDIENLVRPSEFAASLEEHKITKKEFYNFITNNRTFVILKNIKNLTYNNLRDSLMDYIEEIKVLIGSTGISNNLPDEKLIDKVLELFYINFTNWNTSSLRNLLSIDMDLFDKFMGKDLPSDKQDFLIKYVKRLRRFSNNYEDFYETLLRNNSVVAHKMIRKISKVYSLIEDKTQTNESIKDWELYHEIKGTKSKIVTEFDEF